LKKHVLNDNFELNSRVFGLVSTKSFLELASTLKAELDIQLKRGEDITWDNNQINYYSPNYQYYDPSTETNYTLIRNKGDAGWLANEYKTIDAFFVETNFSGMFALNVQKISKAKSVHYCFEIEVDTLKRTSQQRLDIN
jgi:hypothetical protein